MGRKSKFYLIYRNDRLNNLVFLSLSLCTKRSLLFGQRNVLQRPKKRTNTVSPIWPRKLDQCNVKGRQAPELASNLKIEIYISCYTEYKVFGPSQIYNTISIRKIFSLILFNPVTYSPSFLCPIFSIGLNQTLKKAKYVYVTPP